MDWFSTCGISFIRGDFHSLTLYIWVSNCQILQALFKFPTEILGKSFLDHYVEVQYYPLEKSLMLKRHKTANVILCTTPEGCLLRLSHLYAAFEALGRKTNTIA